MVAMEGLALGSGINSRMQILLSYWLTSLYLPKVVTKGDTEAVVM